MPFGSSKQFCVMAQKREIDGLEVIKMYEKYISGAHETSMKE